MESLTDRINVIGQSKNWDFVSIKREAERNKNRDDIDAYDGALAVAQHLIEYNDWWIKGKN